MSPKRSPEPDAASAAADGAASRTRYTIDAVARVLDLLQVFIDEKAESLSLSELTAKLGLNKNAVFRLLATLLEKGFLVKTPANGRYQLSLKFLQLGRAVRLASDLRSRALPHMKQLWEEFEDTINLAVLDRGQICYLEALESPHRFKFVASAGDNDPVHCTALGKAMIAYLPEAECARLLEERGMPRFTPNTITTRASLQKELARIRQQGYAVNDGEMVEGSRCVAAPILTRSGVVAGALSVSGTATRIGPDRVRAVGLSLARHCAQLSAELD